MRQVEWDETVMEILEIASLGPYWAFGVFKEVKCREGVTLSLVFMKFW